MVAGSEMSPSFASSSRCKRSFGVNLRTARGLEIVKRLVAVSDVVIENSSTGTMEKIGLGFEQMREINPRIVLASSQLMGATGPWKDWIGFGPNSRTAGAMTYLWNFPEGGMPPGSGAIHPDHLAGRMLRSGAIATLFARERRGVGGHVEVAQVEVIIGLLADLILKAALEPGSVGPQGNRSARGAPWGVYPCAGNERWCVITVRNDDDWRRFRAAIGDPDWARERQYETAPRANRSSRGTRSTRYRVDLGAHRSRGDRDSAARRRAGRLHDVCERHARRPASARARLSAAGGSTRSGRDDVRGPGLSRDLDSRTDRRAGACAGRAHARNLPHDSRGWKTRKCRSSRRRRPRRF